MRKFIFFDCLVQVVFVLIIVWVIYMVDVFDMIVIVMLIDWGCIVVFGMVVECEDVVV